MADEKLTKKLRQRLDRALKKGRDQEAIEILAKLQEVDPKAPRWPHKRGDLLRRAGRRADAVVCYAFAVELYAELGFIARAVALAKTILNLDPSRIDVLSRVDPEAARSLHRQQRPRGVSGPPEAKKARHHPMVIPDAPSEPAPRPEVKHHPMVIPDDAPSPVPPPVLQRKPARPPQPRKGHPMVIEDEAAPPPAPASPQRRKRKMRPRPVTLQELSLPPMPAPPQEAGALTIDRLEIPAAPKAPNPIDAYHSVLSRADELTIAPDVRPNETRFSNAPPRRSIELDITEAELGERAVTPRDESLAPEPPTAANLSQLPLFPLFAEIPKASLMELVTTAELIELDDGAYVMRAGEVSDSLYGIIEGGVRIAVPGQHIRLNLAEGDVFGESCLLRNEPGQADVQVQGRLVALCIPRALLMELIQRHPALAEVLLELLTRRLLGTLLQSSPLFQELDATGRRELAQRFEIRRAGAGTMLSVAGKQMDGLYISLTGTLEVTEPNKPPTVVGPGHMFGQNVLVGGEPALASVRAAVNMVVLRLPAMAFTELAMQHPSILAHISELADTPVAKITL